LRLQRREIRLLLLARWRLLPAGRRITVDSVGRRISRITRVASRWCCSRRAVTARVVNGWESNRSSHGGRVSVGRALGGFWGRRVMRLRLRLALVWTALLMIVLPVAVVGHAMLRRKGPLTGECG
jgi:hypothetical protein